MTPEQSAQVEELFAAAADLPADGRLAVLEAACGAGPEVLAEVEALLAAEARIGRGEELPPTAIGPYRIVRKIGEGGMSEVFLGIRSDGAYEGRVAIKRIRGGLRTPEMTRRFEIERRILASLNHPAIARLLDAGESGDGAPYLILEYVDGEPIDLYCDRHRLSIAERLELFAAVCQGVHFAHQNLIVHRDLKPSNILVTAGGQPKLLDFGVAKMLNPALLPRGSEPTAEWVRVLTPEYASPEQLLGRPLTTASDLYALGVLLFKLLTGVDPYGHWERPESAIEQLALTAEPEAPSRCVRRLLDRGRPAAAGLPDAGELAHLRSLEPRAWWRSLEGGLDELVLQALRKEPQRRPPSAAQLAAGLTGHFGVRPDGRSGGRTHRPWRSIALPALAGALVLLAALTPHFLREHGTRTADGERAKRVEGALRRLLELPPADPAAARQATEILRTHLERDPASRAELFYVLGESCRTRGWAPEASLALESALAAQRELGQPASPAAARTLFALGEVDAALGDFTEAEQRHRAALAIRRKLAPADPLLLSESLSGLGRILVALGHAPYAEPLLHEALRLRRDRLGERHPRVAETLEDLALATGALGSPTSSAILFERAERIRVGAGGGGTFELAVDLVQEAEALLAQGRTKVALQVLDEAAGIARGLCPESRGEGVAALRVLAGGSSCAFPALTQARQLYFQRALGAALEAVAPSQESAHLVAQARENLRPPPVAKPLEPDSSPRRETCVPDGGFAQVGREPCCSGVVAGGSTYCAEPGDWGGNWASCRHVCASRTVQGCVPPGGVTDSLRFTDCCSGAPVPRSTRCLNPDDAFTSFRTCIHTCS